MREEETAVNDEEDRQIIDGRRQRRELFTKRPCNLSFFLLIAYL